MTICLNMIVKDEIAVIRRCLRSVKPFIDSWLIVDTGSSDGTQDAIREELASIPGELVERPWRNFGHNRSEALRLARGRAEYALLIDADEILVASPGFRMPALRAGEYQCLCRWEASPTVWFRSFLARLELDFRYEGVLHEYLFSETPHAVEKVEGLHIQSYGDGARNSDPIAKFRKDARLLEEAVAVEPTNARYVFYLAQSHRDAGELERAIDVYERRASMEGFAEEAWYSLFQIAVLKQQLGRSAEEVTAAYLRAFGARPTRPESLCYLAAFHRERREWALAELFARKAAATPAPDDLLFVDEAVTRWRAQDELAIAAYWTGHYAEAALLNRRLLEGGSLPAEERPRVQENLRYCTERLGARDRPQRNAEKRRRQGRG